MHENQRGQQVWGAAGSRLRLGHWIGIVLALLSAATPSNPSTQLSSRQSVNAAHRTGFAPTSYVPNAGASASLNAYVDGNNHNINAVKATLYFRSNAYSIGGTASSIALCENGCNPFVQMGIVQGHVPQNDQYSCPSPVPRPTWTAPHLFLAYKRTNSNCDSETLTDLGVLGVLGYREMSIELYPSGDDIDAYFYLDGVFKASVADVGGLGWIAKVTGEVSDSCSFGYVRANTDVAPNYDSLMRRAEGQPWLYWGVKSEFFASVLSPASAYERNEPVPTSQRQFLNYGRNDGGGC